MDSISRRKKLLSRTELRQEAERLAATSDTHFQGYTLDQGLEMLHELQVHQIELEMQNKALQESCEEVRDLETHYRSLFYGAPVAYLNCDLEGRIVDSNDRAQQLLGETPESLCGKVLGQFLSVEMADRLHILERSAKGAYSTIQQVELTFMAANGTHREVLVEIRALPASDRAKPMKLFALMDITAQKVAESELQAIREQLVHLDKMASVGMLAAGVAHEINNPIGYVRGNTRLLDSNVETLLGYIERYRSTEGIAPFNSDEEIELARIQQELPELKEDIEHGISRVVTIVQDLKQFSHPGTADWVEADLNNVIEQGLRIVWNEFKRSCELSKTLGALSLIRCRPHELGQLVVNLVINAVQAMEQGGVLSIRTYAQDDEVIMEIADTGSGISSADQKRLFDPFFTTRPVGVGTGLGLSISHGIVTRHQGRISVISQLGQGTTFTVRLPVTQGGSEAA
ncbi:MAG: ATP-binding protein [Halopseudomonas sp.]